MTMLLAILSVLTLFAWLDSVPSIHAKVYRIGAFIWR